MKCSIHKGVGWFLVFCYSSLFIFFFLPTFALAVTGSGPSTLVDIPQVNSANGINGYIEALYTLAITAASLIAIIQLIKAGSKYVFSAVVTDKGEAKKDIRNALIGLLIIIGAVTILNEINPQLTNLNILGNATQLTNPGGSNVPIAEVGGSANVNDITSEQRAKWVQECERKGGKVELHGTLGQGGTTIHCNEESTGRPTLMDPLPVNYTAAQLAEYTKKCITELQGVMHNNTCVSR